MPTIRTHSYIEADFIEETPEVSGPRGWAEGALALVRFDREEQGKLLLTIGEKRYLVYDAILTEALKLPAPQPTAE